MAHTAIGHLEELKKKELVIAAMMMTEEEFTALADKRKGLLNESSPRPVDAIENAIDDACSAPGNDDGIMGDSEGI